MTDKVREQILKDRDTGKTNMFDTCMVQRLGLQMHFLRKNSRKITY